jgi:hypothetical protein
MSYTAAVTELRQLLGDSEYHKKATEKKLIGRIDGENTVFYSYDKRLLEDSLEVFVNGEAVSFALNDAIKGQITLAEAPEKNSTLVANYYFVWWIDEELKTFLNKGAESVSLSDDIPPEEAWTQLSPGLRKPGLYFAAHDAIMSLVTFLVNRRHSEEFLIQQDGNDDSGFSQMINALRGQAKDYWDRAIAARDDYYERQGKRNLPSFAIKPGVVKRYGPRR